MDDRTRGYLIFVAAFGMMCGSLSVDIAILMDWSEITKPTFVAGIMGHIAAIITAFIGGKLIPESRPYDARTRITDKMISR